MDYTKHLIEKVGDKKPTGKLTFPPALIKQIALATDNNDHNDARILASLEIEKDFGDQVGFLHGYQSIKRQHERKGFLDTPEKKKRDKLDKELFKWLRELYKNGGKAAGAF